MRFLVSCLIFWSGMFLLFPATHFAASRMPLVIISCILLKPSISWLSCSTLSQFFSSSLNSEFLSLSKSCLKNSLRLVTGRYASWTSTSLFNSGPPHFLGKFTPMVTVISYKLDAEFLVGVLRRILLLVSKGFLEIHFYLQSLLSI